ncbi:MAG: HAD-IA family hydrolase [Fimbriimonadales bacterium]
MIDLVTLDAAGTIIDHRWDPGGIAAQAARSVGLLISAERARPAYDEVYARFRPEQEELERSGNRGAIKAMWQRQMAAWLVDVGGKDEDAPEVLARFEELAFGPRSHIFALYEDALPAIEAIKAAGFRLGVISNWDHTLFGVLESLGVDGEFDFIIASLVFGSEKPDKSIFMKACEHGRTTPERTLHVGDSEHDDFLGAQNAGMRALLINRNDSPSIPDGRINSLTQIMEAIECFA